MSFNEKKLENRFPFWEKEGGDAGQSGGEGFK
jgi:hypothetical protein